MQDGHRPAGLRMPREQPIQRQARLALAAGRIGAGDPIELLLVDRLRTPRAIANPVQAHIGRDRVEQARRITRVEALAPLDDPHEHVLTRVERLLLGPQQLAAAPQYHGSVAEAEGRDILLVLHATDITPELAGAVTCAILSVKVIYSPVRRRAYVRELLSL